MQTIAVTGGNGRIGRAILEELVSHGYRTVNLARGKQREEISDEYRTTDLLDAGEVYGSLAISDADAVIHMGTLLTPLDHPGYVTFESNVMTSYHVLEAAKELDLEAVAQASSINVLGCAFQEAPMQVDYLPVDESHRATPRDPYALGKHALEVTASGFGRLDSAPRISSLRFPWVATEEELRDRFVEADRGLNAIKDGPNGRDQLFSYLHLEDAASIARLAVEVEFTGHERFWATARDTTAAVPTSTLTEVFYEDAEIRKDFEGHEGIVDISHASDVLGWEPVHSWREL